MEVHEGFDNVAHIKNPVITTGSFDGVHVGHKAILKRMSLLADKINGESVLITFYPHPRKVLYPDSYGKDLQLISTREEKIELLKQTQLKHLILVNFTRAFSRTSSQEFVEDYLIAKLKARMIIVGFNHHFGHNREGDYRYLLNLKKKHHFEVEEIPEHFIQNECVSSTKIRKAIQQGNIQRANAYLDHYYIIKGNHRKERWDGSHGYGNKKEATNVKPHGPHSNTGFSETACVDAGFSGKGFAETGCDGAGFDDNGLDDSRSSEKGIGRKRLSASASGNIMYDLTLNDEEKLIPPSGAYAVSTYFSKDKNLSDEKMFCKGIAYIINSNQHKRVCLTYLGEPQLPDQQVALVAFRKNLWYGEWKRDNGFYKQMEQDKQQVNELIY